MVNAIIIAPKTTKGGAEQQAERQVHAVLHLIHVAGHSGDEGRCTDLVKL